MELFQGSRFTAERAWGGPNVARIGTAQVKLRWTDQPYRWHVNNGREVFAVLDGIVDMHVRREGGDVEIVTLAAGDILSIALGEEHVAHPRGVARILVIEEEDPAVGGG